MKDLSKTPAGIAAAEAMAAVRACIDAKRSFILEAGPGSGKTHSLVESLKYLIQKRGGQLSREGRKIACITFTNVAKNEIESRVGRHQAVEIETIHAFLWSLLKPFQIELRKTLPSVGKWTERIQEKGPITNQAVIYDLGYPLIDPKNITLYHDDVIDLAILFLEKAKFRTILAAQFPIILIDEYQDTDVALGESLRKNFLIEGSLVHMGLFGDHWQMIYEKRCGRITSPSLTDVPKRSNFRSGSAVVNVLNHMRPALPQEIVKEDESGSAICFHTNGWTGARQNGPHDKGDLPPEIAHQYLETV